MKAPPTVIPRVFDRVAWTFWNAETRRLRLPWRLLLFVVGLVFAFLPFGIPGVGEAFVLTGLPVLAARAPALVAQGVVVIVVVGVAAVVLDRRYVVDYGLHLDRAWGREFAVGLALGAGLMTGIFVVAYALGWLRVTGMSLAAGTLPTFLLVTVAFLAVGVYEELIARGYLLVNLAEGLQVGPIGPREATAIASAASAVVFGLVHLANPNASLASASGVTVAGLFLAAGYVFTGELAFPIGVHVTWNLFQGAVFGFPVSGVSVGSPLVATRLTGPAIATGGRFGPEAGLLGVGASVVGTLAVLIYAGRTPDSRVWTPALRWTDDGPGRGDGG